MASITGTYLLFVTLSLIVSSAMSRTQTASTPLDEDEIMIAAEAGYGAGYGLSRTGYGAYGQGGYRGYYDPGYGGFYGGSSNFGGYNGQRGYGAFHG